MAQTLRPALIERATQGRSVCGPGEHAGQQIYRECEPETLAPTDQQR
jgi:hypothetical protein